MKELKAQELVTKAKTEAKQGNLPKSLEYFEYAYKILPSERIKRRIDKLKVSIFKCASTT